MKRIYWLMVIVMMSVTMMAQTQLGYVKTKGRLGSNGSLIKGVRLSGVTITVRGGNAVVSRSNGSFSLSIPSNSYYLQKVEKQGFVLTDMDVLSRQYSYSRNPLVLVLEDKAQQEAECRAIERKVSNNLYAQLQRRQDEIDALKAKNKISEEKYRELLQQLNKYQDDNEQIVKSMVDRYSKIDFDEVDEFNRRISDCILNGRLTEADSLLNTKGDITTRAAALRQHQMENEKEESELIRRSKQLERSKELVRKGIDDTAKDCYTKFEIFMLQHQNDSAAYYIKLRAQLDTTNVERQLEAGLFMLDYMADDVQALSYYEKALRNAKDSMGYRRAFNALGNFYYETGHYVTAIENFKKALSYLSDGDMSHDRQVPSYFSNISSAYRVNNDLDSAFFYAQKALKTSLELLGERSEMTGDCYNTLARLYVAREEYDQALTYDLKVKEIYENLSGDHSFDLSSCYNNLAGNYKELNKNDIAVEYYYKALELRRKVLGDNNPRLATIYNNLGVCFLNLQRYEEAMNSYKQAARLWENSTIFRHRLIDCYGNMGVIYEKIGDRLNALDFFEKGEMVVDEFYKQGERDSKIFTPYIYSLLSELSATSEEYRQRYLHYMDDKVVVGIVPKGMPVPTAQRGMSGVYYILKFGDWNIESDSSFFETNKKLNGKPKDVLFFQDGMLREEHFDSVIGCGWRLYDVTTEEKQHLKSVYENWKNKAQ